MASFLTFLLLLSLSLHLIFVSADDQSPENPLRIPFVRPTKLVLKVQKDGATNLHVTRIFKRTPAIELPFLLDLNGLSLVVNCDNKYLSRTYNAPICGSAQCHRAGSHTCHTCSSKPTMARPGCHANACGVMAVNPITQQRVMGELAEDVLSIPSTLGSTPGPMVTIPQFLFTCAPSVLTQKGLPQKVQGIVGLGHSPISLPDQLASHLGFPPKHSICLASQPGQNGVVFFGEGPYIMAPGIDISRQLTYAPLFISRDGEYLINIQSIQINNQVIPLKTTRRFNQAMISTTIPYTTVERSIFTALTQLYIKQFSAVPQVKAVAPFGVCFNANNISYTRMGPAVPSIHLVLDNQLQRRAQWTIFGQNAMVQVRPGVMCLALVDGGVNPRGAPIVIGAHQLEDNLVQMDLVNSRIGISNSLLFQRTNCANFNFKTVTETP